MKYDSLSRNTVKITLSEEDMREYSLCAENIALSTAQSKYNLARLLRKMELFPACKPERLFLEAFPKTEGGCILYVSGLDEDLKNSSGKKASLMCTVSELDELVRLCFGLKQSFSCSEACVCLIGNQYALLLGTEAEEKERLSRFLSEYGEISADISEICTVKEYGRVICPKNAVESFSALY